MNGTFLHSLFVGHHSKLKIYKNYYRRTLWDNAFNIKLKSYAFLT